MDSEVTAGGSSLRLKRHPTQTVIVLLVVSARPEANEVHELLLKRRLEQIIS